MIAWLIGVAVFASVTALVLLYWRVLALTFPEKLATEEVYKLTTPDLWKIRVCRYRKGRTNGQPVLLVHGANVNQHTFTSPRGSNLVEYLVERGFDCWTVDLRGCRSSEAPFERHRNQITTDDFLNNDIPAAIRLVQQETGYAKIHYCGQSLGGMLLYAYVLKFGGDAIASGVTLGSPIGFDGVRVGRSPWMARLIKFNPALAGEVSRGLIPFALLFRSSPLAFPMNLRNIARGLNTGHFYNMLEDPLPGVLRDLITWIRTPGWRMDQGQLDVQEGLKQIDVPLLTIFAPLDPFVPIVRAQAFFDALPVEDKRILIASRELGCKRDYNHCDLAFGLEGPREIFAPIARWFDSHSSREQIVQVAPATSTGYQAPLRAAERAEILSGDSFARRAQQAPESRTAAPEPSVKRGTLAGPASPVAAPEAPVEIATAPAEPSAPIQPEPIEARPRPAKKAPAQKPVAKKAPTAKPAAKKPAVKKPAAKKPAAKQPAVKKPAAKKAAAEQPVATQPDTPPAVAKKPTVKKPSAPGATPAVAKASPAAKKSTTTQTAISRPAGKGTDLASVSAALTSLRPSSSGNGADKVAPIRVKKSGGATPPGKDEPVETPKSVLKALSNASDALDAFKKKGGPAGK